jgi:hypothetical protein
MTTALLRVKRALLATSAAAGLMIVASSADASCRMGRDDEGNRVQLCSNGTHGSSYAAYSEDDEDDEDIDADDDDDDDDDEFVYDENQGSLLVDQSDCAPGKYWMMYTDQANDVMLPCR